MSAATAAVPARREETAAVPTTPLVFFPPLSSHLAYLHSANSAYSMNRETWSKWHFAERTL